jgi:hypothetical protein
MEICTPSVPSSKLTAASLTQGGQTRRLGRAVRLGYRDEPAVDLRTSAREGPVGADAREVDLGSAGHLERFQMSQR